MWSFRYDGSIHAGTDILAVMWVRAIALDVACGTSMAVVLLLLLLPKLQSPEFRVQMNRKLGFR